MYPGFTNDDAVGIDLLTVSAEGRVEHQKLNQKASFGWVSDVQLDLLEKNGSAMDTV